MGYRFGRRHDTVLPHALRLVQRSVGGGDESALGRHGRESGDAETRGDGELRAGHEVADGVDALDRRLPVLVDHDVRVIVVDLAALLPYGNQGKRIDDLTTEDILALCIYRGGPQATLETYVRGNCVYRAPEPATRV